MSYQDKNQKQQPTPGSTTNKPREGGLDNKDKFQDKSKQGGQGGQGTQSK